MRLPLTAIARVREAVTMYSAAMILRVGSEALHSIMGGMCVFCLYYAANDPDPHVVWYLILDALQWGVLAAAVLYCKIKYLES